MRLALARAAGAARVGAACVAGAARVAGALAWDLAGILVVHPPSHFALLCTRTWMVQQNDIAYTLHARFGMKV